MHQQATGFDYDYWTVFGIAVSLIFIVAAIIGTHKLFKEAGKDVLVKFVVLVFVALVSIFIVDKIVIVRRNILSPAQSDSIFDLVKTLTLMIFSYYFGTKSAEK